MKLKNYGEGIAKGMAVTMINALRRPITTQYPEQKLSVSKRTRGNILVWDKEQVHCLQYVSPEPVRLTALRW